MFVKPSEDRRNDMPRRIWRQFEEVVVVRNNRDREIAPSCPKRSLHCQKLETHRGVCHAEDAIDLHSKTACSRFATIKPVEAEGSQPRRRWAYCGQSAAEVWKKLPHEHQKSIDTKQQRQHGQAPRVETRLAILPYAGTMTAVASMPRIALRVSTISDAHSASCGRS